jgi:hypothetical protein
MKFHADKGVNVSMSGLNLLTRYPNGHVNSCVRAAEG